MIDITIRACHELDAKTIMTKWVSSSYNHHPYRRRFQVWEEWLVAKRQSIMKTIKQGAEGIVAANPDDLNDIWGFCVYTTINKSTIIEYIWVAPDYRRKGIATQLLVELLGGNLGVIYCTDISKYIIKIDDHHRKTNKNIKILNVKLLLQEQLLGGSNG